MTIISRMFMKQAMKVFGLSAGGLLLIFLLFDFFDTARAVAGRGVGTSAIFHYLFLMAPRYLVFAIPISVLLSTVVSLGVSARDRELVAIRALGGSLRRSASVFVALGAFWTVAIFMLSDAVAPAATQSAQELRNSWLGKKEPKVAFTRESAWIRSGRGALVKIDAFSGSVMRGVSVYEFSGGVKRRIEADYALWDGSAWVLKDARVFGMEGGAVTIAKPGAFRLDDIDGPAVLGKAERQPEEMNSQELKAYTNQLLRAGFRADKYLVNLHGKFSYPMICLAMSLIGASLAMRQKRGGGMRAGGYAVGLTVIYWASHMLLLSLGYTARIPAVLSAWAAPVVFLALGGFLYYRSEDF